MRRRVAFLALALALPAAGQYVYDYSESPVIADGTRWSLNGSPSFTSTGVSFSGSGSLISIPAISGVNPSDYEINTNLAIKSGGGTFIQFFRADSASVVAGSGNYDSAEIVVPSGFSGSGVATLNVNQCVGGVVTQIYSTQFQAADGMNVRGVVFGPFFWVLVNGQLFGMNVLSTSGNAGIGGYGMNGGNGFTSVKLGHHDTIAPGTVEASTVVSSVLPNSVSLRWQGVVDDPNGIGFSFFEIYRNGAYMQSVWQPETADATVQPSTTYTYQVLAWDYHGNSSTSAPITITTPPAQSIDPRRVGISKLGSYWGGGGEQIDTRSGNLNFSLPLVSAQGRAGWSVPVGLSYNSQNWRNDNGVNWQLGDDVGYGFGWKAQIGSLTPYYVLWWEGVDHYVYEDGSGAQYLLNVNNGGVWSSQQSIYVWFDSNANVLHFKDGSFWTMGCTSGGTEADAGTLYPTLLEDTNGNEVIVTYLAGAGAGATNTSARIATIEDVRGMGSASYTFSWNSDSPVPHLSAITNALGTPETYNFTYAENSWLEPPFGLDPNWAGLTTAHLSSVTPAVGPAYQFTYDTAGASELLQATVPSGGHLRWVYGNGVYGSNRKLREVSSRYVAADALGQNEWGPYTFSHSDSGTPTVHSNTTLADASGVGAKTWWFNSTGAAWQVGLPLQYVQSSSSVGGTVLSRSTYTWAQDAASNPYIGSTLTTLDEASSNPQSTTTTQTLDQYGNVTQQRIYDYGNASTPIRTYTNTWLHSSSPAYGPAYIRNRMLTSSVTDNLGNNVTLVSNTYDAGALAPVSGTLTEFDPVQGSASNQTRGNVTQAVSPGSTVNYSYDLTGHMLTATNAATGAGASLTYSSSTNFSAPSVAAPMAGTQDAQSGRTTYMGTSSGALSGSFSYNGALSLVGSVMPNSATSSQTFSPSTGLLSSSVSVNGATTSYTYAFNPTVITATTNSHWSRSYKDGFGRDLAVEAGYGSTIVSHVATQYGPCACSPLGKATYVSLPYGISGGQVTASDGTSNIGWNSYVYDGRGRTLTQTAADLSVTSYLYLGNTVKVTDPVGNWKRYTSDTLGNLVKVEEPNPAYGQMDNAFANFVTNYTYDLEGHLTGVSMPRPNGGGTYTQTRSFNYNLMTGQLMSATNPESGTVMYGYYPSGKLQSKVDAKGQKVLYSYDGYGRVTYIDRYPNGTTWDPCQSVYYTYDSPNGNGMGRLTGAATGNYWADEFGDATTCGGNALWEQFGYTPGGLTQSRAYSYQFPATDSSNGNVFFPSAGPFAGYTYDNEGHLTSYNTIGPTVQTFTYTLDAMGRPTGLTQNNGTVWVQNAAYGPAGELQTMQYATSSICCATETRSYNSRGQLKELSSMMPGSGTGTPPRLDLQYIYHAGSNNGQIAQMNDMVSGEQTVYTYDSLKRLVQAQASVSLWGQSFGYDGFGNLISKTPTAGHTGTGMSLSVDPSTNRVTTSGFGYDANGNTTSFPTTSGSVSLSYDVENRTGGTWFDIANRPLDRVDGWSLYGLHGERLETVALGSYFDWGYAGYGTYVEGAVGETFQTSHNIYFGSRLIQSKGTTVATDRLGSVRLDENGGQYEYYPYGEMFAGALTSGDLFATYTRESATGLDYANQRYYSSAYGRFNRPDPSGRSARPGNPLSWNRYSYVGGDPANRADPTGLIDCDPEDGGDGYGCYCDVTNSCDDMTVSVGGDGTETIGITVTIPFEPAPYPVDPQLISDDPDYQQLCVTAGPALQGGVCVAKNTHDGTVFFGPSVSFGSGLPPVLSISAVNGQLNQTNRPTASEVNGWLGGLSTSGTVSVPTLHNPIRVVSVQVSNGNNGLQTSTEVGVGSPQIGISAGWNICIKGPGCKVPQ